MFRSPGPVLVHMGPIALRWYGVLMAVATATGLWLAYRAARRADLDARVMVEMAELAALGGLVGARIYYVAFTWEYYRQAPWKILAVWEGGFAIHGGLLAGLLVGGAYGWFKGVSAAAYFDVAAPPLVLGQAIGRWGNFFNEESFGTPTNLPWRLFISPSQRPLRFAVDEFFHPAFLYESLWNVVVFVLLTAVLRRRLRRAPGALFLAYVGCYSFGRWWLEMLRTDALMLGPIRVAQLVSLMGIAMAIGGVPLLLRRGREG